LGHRFKGNDAETLVRRRRDEQRRARHQTKLLLRAYKAAKLDVFVIGYGNVGDTGNDQAQIPRMRFLIRDEVFKQLLTAFVRIDATAVEQIRRRRPLGFAWLGIDRHRHDSSRQLAPELTADTLLRRCEPHEFARTAGGVFVNGQIRRQFVVQRRHKQRVTRGKLLDAEVGCWVKVSDEKDRAIIAPVVSDEVQQRLGVRALMTNELFLQSGGPTQLGQRVVGFAVCERTECFDQAAVQSGPVNTAADRDGKTIDVDAVSEFGARG